MAPLDVNPVGAKETPLIEPVATLLWVLSLPAPKNTTSPELLIWKVVPAGSTSGIPPTTTVLAISPFEAVCVFVPVPDELVVAVAEIWDSVRLNPTKPEISVGEVVPEPVARVPSELVVLAWVTVGTEPENDQDLLVRPSANVCEVLLWVNVWPPTGTDITAPNGILLNAYSELLPLVVLKEKAVPSLIVLNGPKPPWEPRIFQELGVAPAPTPSSVLPATELYIRATLTLKALFLWIK